MPASDHRFEWRVRHRGYRDVLPAILGAVRVAILGLGLIGGSVARAALAAGSSVTAWTPGGHGPRAALADGIAAVPSLEDAVRDVDLVVIAAPPIASIGLLADLAPGGRAEVPATTVVTDVVSSKARIVARARELGLRFVGGHPLAGRETTGYAAADPGLFRDRPWVVVPPQPSDPEALDRVGELVAACGARLTAMDADEHDRAVAAISHLPLLVSAALVEMASGSSDWDVARALAAGGWAGMTRLAHGDPEMGAGILETNAAEVGARLAILATVLDDWGRDLSAADAAERLRDRLARTRLAIRQDEP
jgi:prephenate dehydrogenase